MTVTSALSITTVLVEPNIDMSSLVRMASCVLKVQESQCLAHLHSTVKTPREPRWSRSSAQPASTALWEVQHQSFVIPTRSAKKVLPTPRLVVRPERTAYPAST